MNTTIPLQTTYPELLSQLGKPLSEATGGGQLALYYNSEAPTLADIYILENNRVVLVSKSYYTAPKILSDYMQQYGKPTYSVWKYPNGTPDSLRTLVHVWPQAGRLVVTVDGPSVSAHVIREEQFAPQSLAQYLSTWGKNLVGHTEATISAATVTTPIVTYIPTKGLEGKSSRPGDIVLGVGVVLIVVVIVLVIRKVFVRRH